MEIWKDIKNYCGLYQISNLGRVKSLSKSWKCGNGTRTKIESILKLSKNRSGYYHVVLHSNNTQTHHIISRLVAEAFLENPNNLPQVNHINGIKTDNYAGTPENNFTDGNLEWCSAYENTKHATLMGLRNNIGENNPRSKLYRIQIQEIRDKYKTNKYSQRQLANEYNVARSTIHKILHSTIWKEI